MATRYVLRTVDEDWIDLAGEPVRIDDRRAAWAEAKRRVAADPDLKTVVLNRDTGALLWQSDPDIPPRYQVVTASPAFIDDAGLPVKVLSEHKDKDGAWTAFYDAVAAPATVCENAALFGATPERDEFDTRDVWDADEAVTATREAFGLLADVIACDGFQLADERESLLWGFVNMLDAQTQRLDRAADKMMPELRDLQRDQDGTEIKARELELLTDRAQNLTDRRDAFETMRDAAAESYRTVTGNTWRPRRGSHTSQTGTLTSAAIDARDYMRAKKDRGTQAHLSPSCCYACLNARHHLILFHAISPSGSFRDVACLDCAKCNQDSVEQRQRISFDCRIHPVISVNPRPRQ